MHPYLHPRLATHVAVISLAIWCAFALLVFTIGASPRGVSITAGSGTNETAEPIALVVANEGPQVTARAIKGDRLPPFSLVPPPSTANVEPEQLKPAEALDYAQAEAEHVRSAHAEMPDLCKRHGMHKRYFNVGRRQSWRCER